jgi:predicted membrane protein
MPAIVLSLIQVLPLLISAAKDAQPIIDAAKGVIADLANKGQISVDVQNALHQHIDDVQEAILAGNEPPEFVVAPDPE